MAKPSHDQKRKARLKKRAERSPKHESLAYSGNKYMTEEFAPIIFQTEIGIYQSYVMCNFKLTDDVVEKAIESLVLQMREGPLPPVLETDELILTEGEEGDLMVGFIRRNWLILEDQDRLPGRSDLTGVLRTILYSIEIWRSKSMHPQGYLRYLAGFMKKAGVTVQAIPDDSPSLLDLDE